MSWLASEAGTYELEIIDPESEEKATVTLKRLTAGEHALVQDAMFDDERGEGQVRLVLVQHAVVSWTLPIGAPTPEKIAGLRPEIFLQIYVGVKDQDRNPFVGAVAAVVALEAAQEATTNGASPAPADVVAADGE